MLRGDLLGGSVVMKYWESRCHPITPYGEPLALMVNSALARCGSITALMDGSTTPTVVTSISMIATFSASSGILSANTISEMVATV